MRAKEGRKEGKEALLVACMFAETMDIPIPNYLDDVEQSQHKRLAVREERGRVISP